MIKTDIGFGLKIIAELWMVGLLLYGILKEDKLVAFEDRIRKQFFSREEDPECRKRN